MRTYKMLLVLIFLFLFDAAYGQKKFKVEEKETGSWTNLYILVDEQGKIIRQLDTSKYYTSFSVGEYVYFAVFGKKGSPGWTAIDADENELFKVFNTSFGEPSPDFLVEKRIRIIDEHEKIGFANEKGEIVVTPQFEIVTSFHNGKAIVGETCKKVPWDAHAKETDCQHFSIVCGKYGYIDGKGVIQKFGEYSFETIMKEIGWKPPEEY